MQWSFRRICVYVDPNIQDVQGAISDYLHLWSWVFLGMVSPPYASSNFSHGKCVADLAPHLFCHVSKRRAHKRTVLEALTSSGTYTSSGRAWWCDFAAWSRELHLACLSTSRKCSASCPMNDHGRDVGSHGRTWNVCFSCGCWLRCWTADRYHLAWRGLPCPSWRPLCD